MAWICIDYLIISNKIIEWCQILRVWNHLIGTTCSFSVEMKCFSQTTEPFEPSFVAMEWSPVPYPLTEVSPRLLSTLLLFTETPKRQ